jgi:hypothetical protein
MTRLCTNLPRTPFSLDLVTRPYRFRWQIERCFKEWKSYANLHQCDTANAHIAEGLIWTSLCAAVLKRFLAHAAQRVGNGTTISTRRVAMCAHHILDALVAAVLLGVGLRGTLRRGLAYLLANARRANPARDRRTGRLRAGLGLAEVALVEPHLKRVSTLQHPTVTYRLARVEQAREKAIERDLASQAMEINGVATRPFEQACFEGGPQCPGCCVVALSDHRAPASGLC